MIKYNVNMVLERLSMVLY